MYSFVKLMWKSTGATTAHVVCVGQCYSSLSGFVKGAIRCIMCKNSSRYSTNLMFVEGPASDTIVLRHQDVKILCNELSTIDSREWIQTCTSGHVPMVMRACLIVGTIIGSPLFEPERGDRVIVVSDSLELAEELADDLGVVVLNPVHLDRHRTIWEAHEKAMMLCIQTHGMDAAPATVREQVATLEDERAQHEVEDEKQESLHGLSVPSEQHTPAEIKEASSLDMCGKSLQDECQLTSDHADMETTSVTPSDEITPTTHEDGVMVTTEIQETPRGDDNTVCASESCDGSHINPEHASDLVFEELVAEAASFDEMSEKTNVV